MTLNNWEHSNTNIKKHVKNMSNFIHVDRIRTVLKLPKSPSSSTAFGSGSGGGDRKNPTPIFDGGCGRAAGVVVIL